ncbi:MAG: site-specific DNA-methyltransferase [Bacilli bacterium]
METSNLSKIRREKMLETINDLKKNITDEKTLTNLSLIENELTKKKYGLIWEEHQERVDKELETQIPTFEEIKDKEIAPCENDKFNFLLEGDNLHSLYLLEKTHKEKIDVIYIDPPYNTGKEDFIYNDKMIDSLDGYIHSKWLSFMEKRLKIAKELLNDYGLIMISIDENEFSQLKLLCDDILGEQNRLSSHHVQVRYGNKSLNEDNDWQPVMEYVLIYAKNKFLFKANKPAKPYDLLKFCYKITELSAGQEINVGNKKVTIFKDGEWMIEKSEGKIGLLKETWASGSIVKQSGTAAEFLSKYLIQRKKNDGLNVLYKIDNMGEDGLGYRYVTGPKKEDAIRGKFYSGVPLNRVEEIESGNGSMKTHPISNFYDFSGDFGNIRHEGNMPFNSGKKPVKMLKELINYHKNKNAIVLDFFAGSGSTAQAVLELNQEDNGNRKFILCTNNENNICEDITYKRILNVINGYGKYKEIPSNLKYYRCTYIQRINTEKENLHSNLLINIKNLIQLENSIEVDDNIIRIYLDENELDKFSNNQEELNICDKVYISSDILLTSKQEKTFKDNNIEVYIIPEYYFKDEIMEVM